MDGKDLEKALEHDQAAKADNLLGALPAGSQTPVSIVAIGRQLDDKLGLLAKTVALAMLDIARSCTALAMQPSEQKAVKTKDGRMEIEGKPPRPELAEKWVSIAAVAVDLAHKADVLGDRPIARLESLKE